MRMRIGCLAWGSLVWDPRTLPVAGPFRLEGPDLPIEFSRVSLDGRVTLVLDPGAPKVPTYCVPLDVGGLDEAIEALGERERIPGEARARHVGALTGSGEARELRGETPEEIVAAIAGWLDARPLDAVLWTALPTRGPDGEAVRPSFERLLAHLERLEGTARARAEEYIRRTPGPVRTPHRARFEAALARLVGLAGGDLEGRPEGGS
ncbi:MAG TPA: hypothetical protein VKA74_03105 [Myxococcota bacterium]|nr:hypothetical protein [Myxococcota bacterium]